uniref:Uncharacterized protein n=1 Tax=Meloidogyne enterolobii TaxID=390850 RepID=A0A6V7UD73_MELEN|nr:unnamed protein product [Meloidogyne enterolobii]
MPSNLAENPHIQGEQPFDPWSRIYVPWMAELAGTMFFVLFKQLYVHRKNPSRYNQMSSPVEESWGHKGAGPLWRQH